MLNVSFSTLPEEEMSPRLFKYLRVSIYTQLWGA